MLADHRRTFDRDQRVEEAQHLRALVEDKRRAQQSRGFDRLFGAVPSSRAMMEKLADRGDNLGGATSGLLQLLDRVGADLLERAVAEVVARDRLGLLAATTDNAETVPDRAMRVCVLDASVSVPSTLRVFYWLHLHPEVKVVRSVAMPARRGAFGDPGIFEIIKFFPFGFAVTDLYAYEGLPRLDALARRADAEVEVPFSLALAAPTDWPERVDEGNYIMGGRSFEDAVTVRPRPRKSKSPL